MDTSERRESILLSRARPGPTFGMRRQLRTPLPFGTLPLMDLPGPDADAISFTAPLSVWRTEKYGDIGYVTIGGEAAEAIGAHELMRRLELGRN